MKKTISTLILILAVSLSASAQTMETVNVMGATMIETPAEGAFDIVSLVQFSSGSNTVSIQNAIGNMDSLNSSSSWDNADKLYTYNGSGYDTYGLYKPTAGSPYWSEYSASWLFSTPSAASVNLSRGKGVWYETVSGGTSTNLLVSGDVYMDDTFDADVPEGFSILSYPYSSSINLTNLVVSNATASASWDNADKLYTYSGSGYDTYGLYQPTAGSPYWSEYSASWLFSTPSAASIDLDIGKGFWYESVTSKTITFSRAYLNND